jgi:hypothetical protein
VPRDALKVLADCFERLDAEADDDRGAFLLSRDVTSAIEQVEALRAVLAPRLDYPLVRGPVGMICAWCSTRALPTEDDYREGHRPGCPVLSKDALLGRSATP